MSFHPLECYLAFISVPSTGPVLSKLPVATVSIVAVDTLNKPTMVKSSTTDANEDVVYVKALSDDTKGSLAVPHHFDGNTVQALFRLLAFQKNASNYGQQASEAAVSRKADGFLNRKTNFT